MEEINRFKQKVKNASGRNSVDLRLSISEATHIIKEINQMMDEISVMSEIINTQPEEEQSTTQFPMIVNVSGDKF